METTEALRKRISQRAAQTSDLRTLIEHYLRYSSESEDHSKWTIRPKASRFNSFSSFCERIGIQDVYEINHYIIEAYFEEYSQNHKISTTNKMRQVLKTFIRWLDEYKEMTPPIRPESIKLRREEDQLPVALDLILVKRVIALADHAQDSLMIELLLQAGLRIGELVRLSVADLIGTQVYIEGKGEQKRVVFITEQLAIKIRGFIEETGRLPHDPMFQNVYEGYGDRMSIGCARTRVQRCFLNVAGIHMVPHWLRHTFAVSLLRAGCDIVTLKKLLGHKHIETTMIYLRLFDAQVQESYSQYSRVFA